MKNLPQLPVPTKFSILEPKNSPSICDFCFTQHFRQPACIHDEDRQREGTQRFVLYLVIQPLWVEDIAWLKKDVFVLRDSK